MSHSQPVLLRLYAKFFIKSQWKNRETYVCCGFLQLNHFKMAKWTEKTPLASEGYLWITL